MFGRLALAVMLLESFAIANYAVAQTHAATPRVAAKQKVRVRTLDLTHVEPLVGMPASTVVGYPEICSSEGDIFSEVYAESSRAGVVTFPDIFSVSETREVKKVPLKTPTDFKVMNLRSLFPASHQVVGLIQASQPKDLTKDPASFQDIASGKVVENAPQSFFEVNPFTGEIIDQLVVTGPHPGEVHCAAHKRLTTTYYGLPQKQDVPDQLTYASAPR
jgi:hypothetical protein